MPKITHLFLILAVAVQSWALTGKLIDNSGNPLGNASVHLVNADTSVTTDADGAFCIDCITSTLGRVSPELRYLEPVVKGNDILFSSDKSVTVQVCIYTLNGTLLKNFDKYFVSGNYTIPLVTGNRTIADGMHVVTFRAGNTFRVFKHLFTKNGSIRTTAGMARKGQAATAIVAAKTASGNHPGKNPEIDDAIDTLLVSKIINNVTSARKILVYDYGDTINNYTSDGRQIVIIDPSNDNDGDGLTNFEERCLYHTNSEMTTTTGDGIDDASKINNGLDPRVAILPEISISMPNYPVILAKYSEKIGTDTSKTISSGGSYTHSSTFTTQQQINAATSVAVMSGIDLNFTKNGGVVLKGQITETSGYGTSQTWSRAVTESMNSSWNEAVNITRRNEVTITGGSVRVTIDLTNNSSQDITLVNPLLRLSTTGFNADEIGDIIGELPLSNGNEIYLSSKTGENTVTREFSIELSNPALLESVSRYSCGMIARLVNIQFKTALGEIDTMMSNIYRRTAEVTIDPGNYSSNKVIKKRIAACSGYNEFYTSLTDRFVPVTLHDLLKVCDVQTDYGLSNDKSGILSINGLKNGAVANGKWGVVLQSGPDSLLVYSTASDYDPKRISAGNATAITFIYTADLDSDSLPDRVEAALGADPNNPDTDGDGIPDGREYFGWRRESDPKDALWYTNVLLTDTDGDGVSDATDDNPVVPIVNPLDSSVTLKTLTLFSLQTEPWMHTPPQSTEQTISISVNRQVRGDTKLSLEFVHPVSHLLLTAQPGGATLRIDSSDAATASIYTVPLPLVPGTNDVQVTAVSRTGTVSKTFLLTGVQRRLARIPDNKNIFDVKLPASSLQHIARDIRIDFDSIKAMDPLISELFLARTSVYAVPLDKVLANNIIYADDLGDGGNGAANLSERMTETGKNGYRNSYYIVRKFDLTKNHGVQTITDASLSRDYDYAYFLYTGARTSDGAHFITAPSFKAVYQKMPRDIVVDSVVLWTVCITQPPIPTIPLIVPPSAWNIENRIRIQIGTWQTTQTSGKEIWLNVDQINRFAVPVNKPLPDGTPIGLPSNSVWQNDLCQFIVLWSYPFPVGDTWINSAIMPSSLPFHQIIKPEKYPIDDGGEDVMHWDWIESDSKQGLVSRKYRHEYHDRGILPGYYLDNEFKIYWHYTENP